MAEGVYHGRTVLVTGSRRGVGRLISEHFLAGGATVLGFARGEATFTHAGYRHHQVDVGDPAAVQNAFVALRREFPALDILVNNAAVLSSQLALFMAASTAKGMLETNLLGPFVVTREAVKLMKGRKWGRVLNISSMAVALEPMGDSVYAACKAGLTTMGNIMAKEFAPYGVTVNTLAISAFATDMMEQIPQEKLNEVISTLPIPRLAEEDDILNCVDFFCSARSSFITAQTLHLGGVH